MRSIVIACAIAAPALAQDAPVALPDLGQSTYMGFPGGLYPQGQNTPPPMHHQDALGKASQIVPRNAAGLPHPNGRIGFAAVGMSNACQEFGAFQLAQSETNRNARVVIVDAAQGGQDSTAIADPEAHYWSGVDDKIAAAGLTNEQVQVIWLKEAKAGPTGDFPQHAMELKDELRTIVQILHDRFPNLKICLLASRTYGGYADGPLNPEPYAYESGFSVKWLIQQQIAGDPGLNYGHLPGEPNAPLLLWGPYLWANGTDPNNDGLVWLESDFEGDGAHPSKTGEAKVAQRLAAFLLSSPYAHDWWIDQRTTTLVTLHAADDAHIRSDAPNTNFGDAPTLETELTQESQSNVLLRFNTGLVDGAIVNAQLTLRVDPTLSGGRAAAHHVPVDAWSEETVTWNASPEIGQHLGDLPGASRGAALAMDVTSAVASQGNGILSLALTPGAPGVRAYDSSEGDHGPRLVLTVAHPPCPADFNHDGALNILDFVAFANAFDAMLPAADCDADGSLTILDFVCYQNIFTNGCP